LYRIHSSYIKGGTWRVFQNRVLRRIFGPKRDEVTGDWTKLHNKKLQNLYSSPRIIRKIKSRRMRWAGHVARMEVRRGMHIEYWWESQKERDHRVDNIKMDLREIEWDGVDWIDMIQDRNQWRALLYTVLNLRVP
jgi:hypothetical protein